MAKSKMFHFCCWHPENAISLCGNVLFVDLVLLSSNLFTRTMLCTGILLCWRMNFEFLFFFFFSYVVTSFVSISFYFFLFCSICNAHRFSPSVLSDDTDSLIRSHPTCSLLVIVIVIVVRCCGRDDSHCDIPFSIDFFIASKDQNN